MNVNIAKNISNIRGAYMSIKETSMRNNGFKKRSKKLKRKKRVNLFVIFVMSNLKIDNNCMIIEDVNIQIKNSSQHYKSGPLINV